MSEQDIPIGDEMIEEILDEAIAAHQNGRFDDAIGRYGRILSARPNHPDALNLRGVLAEQMGSHQEAVEYFTRAIAQCPEDPEFRRNLGRSLVKIGDVDAALSSLRKAVRLDVNMVEAWRDLGDLCQRTRLFEEAIVAWQEVSRINPADGAAANNEGVALRHLGRFESSVEPLRRATQLSPRLVEAWQNLARSYDVLGRDADMESAFAGLVENVPESHSSHLLHAVTLQKLGRFEAALAALRKSIQIEPRDPESHFLLGQLFLRSKEFGAAAIAFGACAELRPNDPIPALNQAGSLLEADKAAHALPILQKLDQRDSGKADVKLYLSRVYERLGNHAAAINAARAAVEMAPNDPVMLTMLGHLLAWSGEQAEAESLLRHALNQKPWFAMAAVNLGTILAQRGDLKEGLALYREVLAKADDHHPAPRSNFLLFLNGDADASPAEIAAEHRRWAHFHAPARQSEINFANKPELNRKLKIGYVSADWRAHSVAYFMEPLLSSHDRSNVHVVVYDNVATPDHITRHFQTLADEWRRIAGMGDEAFAQLVRADEIDILVDLAGHTADNRLRSFALKPAPIQVSYLGYPNTTGLDAIDYRLTDVYADPPNKTEALYSETLIRLPNTFLCYKPPGDHLPVSPLPATNNLGGMFTFGSFNTLSKLQPAVIALWARVLREVPRSQLLLKATGLGDLKTQTRLLRLFEKEGVANNRLLFAPRTRLYGEHMQTYSRVDIALDSFPYNGTTTTCESMWMGVPVIALAGQTHVARVGVSLLNSVGLQDWIAETPDEYVRIASDMAADLSRLAKVRRGMRARLLESPLMDAASFVRNLESAYRQMWSKWCSTCQPDKE